MKREESDRWRYGEILVRPVRPEDAEDLYQIISDSRVNQTMVQHPAMELSETQAWMESTQPGRHRLIAEVDGRAVGSLAIRHYERPRLDHGGGLGLMVHHDYWNRGVGTALMRAALDLADNWLNLRRLELDVFVHNTTAIRLYQKFGFEIEGTRRAAVFGGGRYLDEHAMARLRGFGPDDLKREPAPLRPRRPDERPVDVAIRPPRPDDAAALYDLFRHPDVCRTTLQLPSQELRVTQERLKDVTPGIFRFVALVDGMVVGHIGLHQSQRPRLVHAAGLGMMVDPQFWGRGVGNRLMEAAIDLADNWLNLKRVELDVNVDNVPGIRLYEKYGFIIEGTKRFHAFGDGSWADSHFMARLRSEENKEQEEEHV